jgi:UDP-N-acetylenolpyruvoylglucosamine reductase
MQIRSDISLKGLNTFQIEASARYFAEVSSVEDILTLQQENIFKDNKKLILGGGSNLLLTRDFDGLVVKVSISGIELEPLLLPQSQCRSGVASVRLVLYRSWLCGRRESLFDPRSDRCSSNAEYRSIWCRAKRCLCRC